MSAHNEETPELIEAGQFIEAAPTVLEAGAEAAGQRLDQWLASALGPDMSRSRVQMLIRQGAVSIDGKPVDETKRKMSAGERVSVVMPEPEPAEPQGEAIALDVLYEDDELIVINKPAGLVVHPGAGNWTGTLVNALIHHCGDSLSGIGGVRRPGIVHRLDKETSGVMVVAKTDRAHKALSEAFADHGRTGDLERAYLALVWGIPPRPTGTVDAPLGRAADRVRRAVVPEGRDDARHAVTHFTVKERFGEGQQSFATASLVECRLETGRTHQIRVHMAHIGHPVIGDPDYGQAFRTKANRLPELLKGQVKAFSRQALHAWLLAFRHPATHLSMRFEAPIPGDMEELVGGFRKL
ncbi:RluA family pseudouridine synthase [Mesorhizobium sp. M0772]|uniref:RluA family pseudouridine synthase n=1 Tax=Mesorhizobium sp. M0772 TaxID=2956998 RepID=UPI0033399055